MTGRDTLWQCRPAKWLRLTAMVVLLPPMAIVGAAFVGSMYAYCYLDRFWRVLRG